MRLSIQSLLLTLAILGVASPAFAQDSQQSPSRFKETHVWAGYSKLNGRSDFWDDNFQNFKASRSDLKGFALGGDYIKHLDLHNALMLSGGIDVTTISEPARNLFNHSGNPREHHLELGTLSLTAGYVLFPAGTQASVIPYLGAGAGLYAGTLRSYRRSFTTDDDCDEDGNCTTTTHYIGSKDSAFLTFGYYVLAGLEVPVSSHSALLVEGRYTVARANLGGDFEDHTHLDLSGAQYTVGMAVRF